MNLVVIVSDTFRYDNLSVGGGKARTPELDAFAAGAHLFENYYISSFPTIPNRTDAFTGRYSFPFHGWQALDQEIPVLAAQLSQNGYATQLLCDTPHLMRGAMWVDRGFTASYVTRGQEGSCHFTKMNQPLRKMMPDDKVDRSFVRYGDFNLADIHSWTNNDWVWEEDRFCARTARLASKWLELNCEYDGFMLWVDMFDPHEPWDPPEYMVRWFDDSGYDGIPMIHPNYALASHYTEAELRNLNAHYRAEASLVSKWVGHIIRKIEDLGLMENTAVVFTTDHGHYLGEHGWVGKENRDPADPRRCTLFRELAHVPLIVHVPGTEGGRVHSEVVQPVDLMPTLLDLAGTPLSDLVHGHSIVPLLRGEASWPRQYAYSSFALADDTDHKKPFPTVTDGQYSYTPRGQYDGPELYDLASDPGEMHNIAPEEPDVACDMHQALVDFLQDLGTPAGRVKSIGEGPV